MAGKSLYDILEVSPQASAEVIRASYERLAATLDPSGDGSALNCDKKIRFEAIKEAFLTLSVAEKRNRYDSGLVKKQFKAPPPAPPSAPAWSVSGFVVFILLFGGAGGYYYHEQQTEKRVTAERELVEAKTREAAEQARLISEKQRAAAEQANMEMQQQRTMTRAEDRIRREHEMALQRHAAEQRMTSQTADYSARREMQEQRRADDQRRREEQQAEAAARAQLARDKAELCRIERERYGRAISC
jgi:DnaJ-class molecular chaperone